MTKRRRAKSTTGAKTKAADKEKVVEPSNAEEIRSKNENISGSQVSVDASPSRTKKAKLDSSLSLSATKSKKYAPPFTASQRRVRLRKDRVVSTEICEEMSNGQQELLTKTRLRPRGSRRVIAEVYNKNEEHGTEDLPEKIQQENGSVVISESNEVKTDKLASITCVGTRQSDVEIVAESVEEMDSKTEQEITVGSKSPVCLSSQEHTTFVKQNENNSTSNNYKQAKDQSTTLCQEIDKQGDGGVIPQVPKLAVLAQQSCSLGEGDGGIGTHQEGDTVEKAIGGSNESPKESLASKLKSSANIVDALRFNVSGLQTLANTCTEEEYIDVVSLDSDTTTTESSQNKLRAKEETETKSLSRKRKSNENRSSQDFTEEKLQETNRNTSPVPPDVITDVINSDPSKVNTRSAAMNKRKSMLKLVSLQISSSNDDSQKTQNAVDKPDGVNKDRVSQKCTGDRVAKSSSSQPKLQSNDSLQLSSQEIIQDKLSEMLSIVCETNMLRLSGTKTEVNINAGPVTENNIKSLDGVTDAGIAGAKTEGKFIEGDESTSGGDQNRYMGESDPNTLANGDENSQNAARMVSIERQSCELISVDNNCILIEKVEDAKKEVLVRGSETNERVKEDTVVKMDLPTSGYGVKQAISTKMELSTSSDVVEGAVSKKMEFPVGCDEEAIKKSNNDQEVPNKMMKSPTSSQENNISDVLKDCCDKYIARLEKTNKNSHLEAKRADVTESCASKTNTVDEQFLAKEFEALEELLPKDDMELFDDIILSQPKYTRVEKGLPDGDSTIEFLINELASLHCMVANYERAVQDMKRHYRFKGRF